MERDIEPLTSQIYKVKDEFWDIVIKYETRFAYAEKYTEQPNEPNYKASNDFKAEINSSVIRNTHNI